MQTLSIYPEDGNVHVQWNLFNLKIVLIWKVRSAVFRTHYLLFIEVSLINGVPHQKGLTLQ